MLKPTIHTNGTPRTHLQEQYGEVSRTLNAALTALVNAAPHERDYYPQSNGAYRTARAAHTEMCNMLRSIRAEYEQLFEDVCE